MLARLSELSSAKCLSLCKEKIACLRCTINAWRLMKLSVRRPPMQRISSLLTSAATIQSSSLIHIRHRAPRRGVFYTAFIIHRDSGSFLPLTPLRL